MRDKAKASSARSSFGRGALLGLLGRAFATRGASPDAQGSGASAAGRARAATLALMLSTLVLLALASSPLASKSIVNTIGSTSSGTIGGLFNTPRRVAVNQEGKGGVPKGTVYVVDSMNNRVQRFGPSGEFVSTWGWGVKDGAAEFEICTVAANCKAGIAGSDAGQLGGGQFSSSEGAQGIAVDPTNGAVYVSDQMNRRIDIFSATGGFGGAFGWGVRNHVEEFQFCTTLTGCTAGNAASGAQGGKFGLEVGGLATDPPATSMSPT